MEKKGFGLRFVTIVVVVALLFGALSLQLANLQLRDGQTYADTAESRTMKTYSLTGERGMILDRNGIPLAYDVESYNVTFYRDPSRNSTEDVQEYTQILLRVLEIVEENGGETVQNFYLHRDEAGNFYLDFLTENEETFAKREQTWRSNLYITNVPEDEIFDTLCKRYGIEDQDYETQYKILSIWQELQMYAYLSKPVTIAYDVDMNTVAQIEAASIELTGASIEQTTKRVYPRGTLASHILGYMGSITESTLEQYSALGYDADDRVGVSGIEASMEEQLSANVAYRQGSQEVEVDANGAVMRELSYEAPVNGNSVQSDHRHRDAADPRGVPAVQHRGGAEDPDGGARKRLRLRTGELPGADRQPRRRAPAPGGDGRGGGAGRAHGRGPGHGQLPGL